MNEQANSNFTQRKGAQSSESSGRSERKSNPALAEQDFFSDQEMQSLNTNSINGVYYV